MYMTQERNQWKSYRGGGGRGEFLNCLYTHSRGKPLLGMYDHIENIFLAEYNVSGFRVLNQCSVLC